MEDVYQLLVEVEEFSLISIEQNNSWNAQWICRGQLGNISEQSRRRM